MEVWTTRKDLQEWIWNLENIRDEKGGLIIFHDDIVSYKAMKNLISDRERMTRELQEQQQARQQGGHGQPRTHQKPRLRNRRI